jgi:hypothetical protein
MTTPEENPSHTHAMLRAIRESQQRIETRLGLIERSINTAGARIDSLDAGLRAELHLMRNELRDKGESNVAQWEEHEKTAQTFDGVNARIDELERLVKAGQQ